MDEKLVCCKCNEDMIMQKVTLEYLGIHVNHELLQCPVCKQVYISKEIVDGKMFEIELQLEDK